MTIFVNHTSIQLKPHSTLRSHKHPQYKRNTTALFGPTAKYHIFCLFKKSLNLSLFIKIVLEVKQTKTDPHKGFHPSSLTTFYQQTILIMKKTTVLCPSSAYYYSTVYCIMYICLISKCVLLENLNDDAIA